MVKGMDEFLDVEMEPSDGGYSNDDDAGSDNNTGIGYALPIARGDEAPVRSPSPKHH